MKTMNWAGHTPWATIKAVVLYEYHGQPVNHLATSLAVFRYFLKNGTFDTMREMPSQWRQDEFLHACILDYFSMFEPVYNY